MTSRNRADAKVLVSARNRRESESTSLQRAPRHVFAFLRGSLKVKGAWPKVKRNAFVTFYTLTIKRKQRRKTNSIGTFDTNIKKKKRKETRDFPKTPAFVRVAPDLGY